MNVAQYLKKHGHWWTLYWFSPAPSFNLGICRILIVGFQVIRLITNQVWQILVDYSTIPDFIYDPLIILQLFLSPLGADYRPSLFMLETIFVFAILSGILGVIGFFTNLSLIIFAFSNIFIQAYLYSFKDYHHSEALVMLSLLILALSPAGQVLSLDDLRRRIRKTIRLGRFEPFDIKDENSHFVKWPLLLIQWIFAIIYFDSAMSKLLKGGLDWMNGYTLQYYLWQDGLIWNRPVGIWLAQQHTLTVLSSWVAIIFELSFPLVLIFRKLIWFYIPVGICFHTGIYIAQKAPFLKYFPSYSVFIPWAAIAKTISRRFHRSSLGQKPEIIYDNSAHHCLTIITVLSYFDWFNCLTVSDWQTKQATQSDNLTDINLDNYQKQLYLVLPSGSKRKGFLAFRESLRYLPALWLLYPVLSFPFVSKVSAKLYKLMKLRK